MESAASQVGTHVVRQHRRVRRRVLDLEALARTRTPGAGAGLKQTILLLTVAAGAP